MSQASLGPKVFVNGNPVQLGKRIGKGGEGEVYFLANNPRRVVKLYTLKDLTSREAKVRDMVRAQLHAKTDFVAFPTEMVLDAAGRFSGFLMRAVNRY